MDERISVIMPYYNGSVPLLKRAIRSADALSYTNKEIVIVDDGSDINISLTDIVNECGLTTQITVLKHDKNMGIAAARNTAVANATGEWLIWLDCDDTLDENCIERLLSASNNALMVIGECCVHEVDTVSFRQPEIFFRLAQKYYKTEYDPIMLNVFSLQPQIVKKTAVIEAGLFNTIYQFAEMTEFFLRFVTRFGICAIKTVHGAYYHYNRNVPNSISKNRLLLEKYRLMALRSYAKNNLIPIDDVVYLGRSDNFGTQLYAPIGNGVRIFTPYAQIF